MTSIVRFKGVDTHHSSNLLDRTSLLDQSRDRIIDDLGSLGVVGGDHHIKGDRVFCLLGGLLHVTQCRNAGVQLRGQRLIQLRLVCYDQIGQ